MSVELKKWKNYWREFEKKTKEPDDRRQVVKNIFTSGKLILICWNLFLVDDFSIGNVDYQDPSPFYFPIWPNMYVGRNFANLT